MTEVNNNSFPEGVVSSQGVSRRGLLKEAVLLGAGTFVAASVLFRFFRQPEQNLSPQQQNLNVQIGTMRLHSDASVRDTAVKIYSKVIFANTSLNNDSTVFAIAAARVGPNGEEYTILASSDLFSKELTQAQAQEAQRQLYKSYLILEQVQAHPGQYGRNSDFTNGVIMSAEATSQQLFPQIAQGHDR